MKELKLILIICWIILFPIINDVSDILSVKYKIMRGVKLENESEKEVDRAYWLEIIFFFAVILFIHYY